LSTDGTIERTIEKLKLAKILVLKDPKQGVFWEIFLINNIKKKNMLELDDLLGLNTKIYDELKAKRNDNEELQNCITDTVVSLFNQTKESDGLYKPICLLGKIQSGKTRAFIGIIAKAFDEGIHTIIVLTKNSKILGVQTTKRIANELHSLESGKSVCVDYITEIDQEVLLGISQLEQKRIIVGIKHHKNVAKIYDYVVQRNPELATKKILIIDDEADVSGIGYRRVSESVPFDSLTTEEQEKIIKELEGADVPTSVLSERKEMLLVAEGINRLRTEIPDHRYLQVTATPSSIFLQPDKIIIRSFNDDYSVENIEKAPLLSDKTVLLPIHNQYKGGEFFLGESEDEKSLAYYVYRDVSNSELKFMSKRDQRHINNIFKSGNFPRLTEFVDNILIAVASNTACLIMSNDSYPAIFKNEPVKVLNAIYNKLEGFSSMIHTSTSIEIHQYQTDLMESYILHCKNIVTNNPENLIEVFKDKIFKYFETSIMPAFEIFKSDEAFDKSIIKNLDRIKFDFIFECLSAVLKFDHVKTFIINSDKQIEARIDSSTGELKREVLANIYIGGQSLDRGITLQRMLCFFYGREPKVAQLDTTLQHARLYGARTPEDLVFTRMYMTDGVHQRLQEITSIDGVLRESIIKNDGDNRFAAIELGANGTVRPTSPDRIMLSDCVNLKSYKRFLPVGFNTRKGNACELPMQKIDAIIRENSSNKIEKFENGELYFITWGEFEKIYENFMNGVIDTDKWDEEPLNRNWEISELTAFYKILRNSYFKEDERLILMVKRGRSMKRVKIDGRLQDAPETSQTDTREMKEIMDEYNLPGIMLFEQEGSEDIQGEINYGWNNQRFYWPLFMLPKLRRNIFISYSAFRNKKELR
jgi:hypothetical protein